MGGINTKKIVPTKSEGKVSIEDDVEGQDTVFGPSRVVSEPLLHPVLLLCVSRCSADEENGTRQG